ncbi:MAG TPA: beta-galactosidase trimerization domain-containing protein [Pirellulaceae bacterium]|nr:beta-galactosidase trimerization domain-containing protein [Pirellulaceae bacterium]
MIRTLGCSLAVSLVIVTCASAEEAGLPAAAQAFGKSRPAVVVQPDVLIVCEGEEFQVRAPGWETKAFGTNYYAATLANTFLSRQAYLGAPEQCDKTVAEIAVEIPAAGKYLTLVRYEAAYRFQTQFRVQVEQGGKLALDRLYGTRDNLKIWAFSQKLKTELQWSWGAGESIVWEGHDAAADLQPGRAIIRLIADKQPKPAAKRNIDLVMLTTKAEEVAERIEKESYLPLDGMLTQSGDIYLKVTNQSTQPLTITAGGNTGGLGTEHSPYWIHQRRWGKFGPLMVTAGQTTDWVEIGSWIDSLNHGQLELVAGGEGLKYRYEFGVKNAAGAIESIGTFDGTVERLPLAYFGDTRYRRRVIHQADVLYELLAHLKQQPMHGKAPVRTPIYGYTFTPLEGDAKHAAAVEEFRRLFSLAGARGQEDDRLPGLEGPRGYIDVRGVATDKLAEYCQQLGERAKDIRVVSQGDEIGLPEPPGASDPAVFREWLKGQGITAGSLGLTPELAVYSPAENMKAANPGLYYWSKRYQYDFGIREIKKRTDILRQHLPSAAIGANFSPHHGGQEHAYLGEVFKWVTCFRQDGMTMPWSEDYIFQVPAGSQQMNNISLDLARAANRGKTDRESMFYVMPHWPGNTPDNWRRMFFGAVQHGATMINLFEFRPVQVAYTENHCSHPEMYAQVLRSFRELGTFEDIVQDGQVRPGIAGLWFSETGDIWRDNLGSFAAAKRGLYTAIVHQQLPLDFVVEQDALDGTLAKYQVLYLTDRHVSRGASGKIAEWVAGGGRLFATAGAGMFDEFNQPNKILRELLGVEQTALEEPGPQIDYIKQDLAFVEPIETATWKHGDDDESIRVFCIKSTFMTSGSAESLATFSDGSPAVTSRAVGKGQAIYCGFLPALSYYQPAIPQRPVDRTSAEDSLAHLIPTKFDAAAYELIGLPAERIRRPVECSNPRVETSVIESPQGIVIPLVNWSGQPVKRLVVTPGFAVPGGKITLASGQSPAIASEEKGLVSITLDLDVADAIILRK